MERSQKNELMMNEGIRVAERDLCLLCGNKGTPRVMSSNTFLTQSVLLESAIAYSKKAVDW